MIFAPEEHVSVHVHEKYLYVRNESGYYVDG